MTVGDCGARRPLLGIVGQFGWRTGRDGKKSSVLVRTQDGRTGRLGTLNLWATGGVDLGIVLRPRWSEPLRDGFDEFTF